MPAVDLVANLFVVHGRVSLHGAKADATRGAADSAEEVGDPEVHAREGDGRDALSAHEALMLAVSRRGRSAVDVDGVGPEMSTSQSSRTCFRA